jgi:hypothetical protein
MSTSTNIFTSKEQEFLNKSLWVKRLAFIIYAGSLDQHLVHLPTILEKMTESFKLSSIALHCQVDSLVTLDIFIVESLDLSIF